MRGRSFWLPRKLELAGVAPDNDELGVMLPYTPLHHLLFAAGAPDVLVMTSANRSSEPIAYDEQDAFDRLSGVADAFLIGQRPIARRVDDSVARVGAFGPVILRRSRGYAPGAVANLPITRPILAVGADLKNTVTLVVDGQAFVSQHIGDLDHYQAFQAFQETIRDLISMYDVSWDDLLLVARCASAILVDHLRGQDFLPHVKFAVQHHRAHVASVLAEHGAWDKRVLGVSFDGTGYRRRRQHLGRRVLCRQRRERIRARRSSRRASSSRRRCRGATSRASRSGFSGADRWPCPMYARARSIFHRAISKRWNWYRKMCAASRRLPSGGFSIRPQPCSASRAELPLKARPRCGWKHSLARAAAQRTYPFPFANGELDFRPLLLCGG